VWTLCGPVDTALVKVGGWWGHHKSGGPPVRRVEPVESAGGLVAYSAGPNINYFLDRPVANYFKLYAAGLIRKSTSSRSFLCVILLPE